ncbi:Condensin complex subunit-like protein [Emericellopsis cladophorae]|uniref:Condensin complex subunit-like protein n=1 Tax=Emericellopsis cladophorae TaxID=2686198 RepID=A0A9Q0BBD1_9HYPO|nr:Condensin complex subunit-like protein [Emericellopsis cladophorae]KAI6779182.1 Condensin complex subunit-like protein [Emericellopsis cladophorae]
MPARTTARPRRAPGTSRPSGRGSGASASAEPTDTPDNPLRQRICSIFGDAQKTTATHRKLAVNLRKIHEACCYEPTTGKASQGEGFDEATFNKEFVRCVLKAMPVKKTESAGEKIIKFAGFFLRHASDKDYEILGDQGADDSILPETPGTRLAAEVLEAVLPLMTAKDKFVRFRATQLVSFTVNSLEAIDDDLFQKLRYGLLKRIRDKEAMVRSQAVLGLGRLAGNHTEGGNDSDDSDDDQGGLLEKLLDVLKNDPAADVRKSLLVTLPITQATLPLLLERARDQDPATRRTVYSRLLPSLGDFRHLSLSMREKLLRWGLRDRDENVRKAAGRLFRERWIEDCAGVPAEGDQQADAGPNFDGLLELLERIDVIHSGVENGVALEAMKGFWEGRPDYRENVELDNTFWETLSAESAFMARSYNDFCRNEGNGKYERLIDEKLPEVTRLAFYLERYLQVLAEAIKRVNQQEGDEDEEEDTTEQEFIVEQLLHIAMTCDYSDEVGRRKMFTLMRSSLSNPDMPDEVTKLTIEVLQGICSPDAAGEREFCSIVLEAVTDVHDTIMDEPAEDEGESFHSARSEISSESGPAKTNKREGKPELSEEEARDKAVKEILVNMKCLHIVQCMLTHVAGNLQDNTDLVAMLNNLVVPAVRSHEAPVRERGLLLTSTPGLLKVYLKAVKGNAKSAEVQAAATVAATKLLLGRVVSDLEASHDLLKSLVVAYFDPASAHNQTVRQALNYFLPVFCYSRPDNQDLMRSVALESLHALLNVRENFEDDDVDVDEDMVSLSTIGACLVDWTDPRKCYTPILIPDADKRNVNGDVHLELAMDILERLNSNISKEEKKLVASLLGKLYISPGSSPDRLRETYTEVSCAVEDGILTDATSRNALYKVHVSLGKIVNGLDESKAAPTDLRASVRSSTAPTERQDTEDRSGLESTSIPEEEEVADETAALKKEEDMSLDDEGVTEAGNDTQAS